MKTRRVSKCSGRVGIFYIANSMLELTYRPVRYHNLFEDSCFYSSKLWSHSKYKIHDSELLIIFHFESWPITLLRYFVLKCHTRSGFLLHFISSFTLYVEKRVIKSIMTVWCKQENLHPRVRCLLSKSILDFDSKSKMVAMVVISSNLVIPTSWEYYIDVYRVDPKCGFYDGHLENSVIYCFKRKMVYWQLQHQHCTISSWSLMISTTHEYWYTFC